MNNKKFQYRLVREKTLRNLPVETGNLTLTSDTNELYADIEGKRVLIDRITEKELAVALAPKADKNDVYTKDETDSKISSVSSGAEEAINNLEDSINKDLELIRSSLADRYTKEEIDAIVASIFHYKGSVANEGALPSEGNIVGDVYNVQDTGANYAWDGNAWDKLSETLDLTPFATKEAVDALANELRTALNNKADKSTVENLSQTTNKTLENLTTNVNTLSEDFETTKAAQELKNTELSNSLLNKVDQEDFDEVSAQVTQLGTDLANKADKSVLDNLSNTVANNKSELDEKDAELENALSKKASSEDLNQISEDLSLKADKSELDGIKTSLNAKVDQITLEQVVENVNKKDAELEEALSSKAEQNDLTQLSSSTGIKIAELEETLALKADKSELTSINSTLESKADKSTVSNIETNLTKKANQADLETVATNLTNKDAELEAAIALKADKTALDKLEENIGEKIINDGTLTIQKNGEVIGTFNANQIEDVTINIEADTQVNADWEADEGAATILNKPKINSVELKGNVTLAALGIQPAGNYATEEELNEAFSELNQMLIDATNNAS